MEPDIERQWIAEELRNEPWGRLRPLFLILVALLLLWTSCG
jgi:hypothetical protein